MTAPSTPFRAAAAPVHPPVVDAGGPAAPVAGVDAEAAAAWFNLHNRDAHTARRWGSALQKPVEYSLELLRRRPARAAELLAPVMDAVVVQTRRDRLARLEREGWRWLAILANPRLWGKAIQALWHGDPVWETLQEQGKWYEVTEAMLEDASTQALLGRVESRDRGEDLNETPMRETLHAPDRPAGSEESDEELLAHERATDGAVLVLAGTHTRLAVRVHGEPDANLRPALQRLCEEADRLMERGTMDPRARQDAIDRLLHRALIRTSPAASPWTWQMSLLSAGALFVLVLAVLLSLAANEYRWQRALASLRDEPGLEVIEDHTAWGRREIIGLRDPFARDPEEVLSDHGIDSADVNLQFKSFLASVDRLPGFANFGARPVAAPPSEAPAEKSAAEAMKLAKNAIEQLRITFDPGSEALTADTARMMPHLCREVAQLHARVAGSGGQFRVSLRVAQETASPRGALWHLRHMVVREGLVRGGVAAACIDPVLITESGSQAGEKLSPDALALRLTLTNIEDTP